MPGMAVDFKELRAEAGKVGFREGRDWLFSPEPLRLSRPEVAQLEKLGHPLARFQQVSDRIYRRSVKGTLPGWILPRSSEGHPRTVHANGATSGYSSIVRRNPCG